MAKAKVVEIKGKAHRVRTKGVIESPTAKKGGEEGTVKGAEQQADARLLTEVIRVDEARQALAGLRGAADAVRPADVVPRRVDMQRAAAVAHSVAVRDAAPARRAEFERLVAGGFYDLDQFDRLKQLALAAWYVRYMLELVQSQASSAAVPAAVVQRAQFVRARMMTVLGYWLGAAPEVAQRLAFLRRGGGHQDLANDLQELARLYERDDLRANVKPGVPNYDEADRDEARTLAATLFTGLGLSDEGEIERWSGLTDRVWTLLVRAYDDHRVKGVFLFSAREDVTATYPTLTSAVRSARPRRRPPAGPSVGEGDGPAGGPGDEPAGEPNEGPTGGSVDERTAAA
jgi:hypothetical protein